MCVCVCVYESLCCTAETNIVNQLYFNFKKSKLHLTMAHGDLQIWLMTTSIISSVTILLQEDSSDSSKHNTLATMAFWWNLSPLLVSMLVYFSLTHDLEVKSMRTETVYVCVPLEADPETKIEVKQLI